MTTNTAHTKPLPYSYLWDASMRLGTSRATSTDYQLIVDGYINVNERDQYAPNPFMVAR